MLQCVAISGQRSTDEPLDGGIAPMSVSHRALNYPDRQRRHLLGGSSSGMSLTSRPLSSPSLEFLNTAPGSRVPPALPAPSAAAALDRPPPRRRYQIPSMFSPSNVHQIKRLGSSWSYSTGRIKTLTPEGQNYVTSHPLMRRRRPASVAPPFSRPGNATARRFDGQQLGPGSYNVPMAMSGRLSKGL